MTEAVMELKRFTQIAQEDVSIRTEEAKAIETGAIQEYSVKQRLTCDELMKSSTLSIMAKILDESNALINMLEHEFIACRCYFIFGIALLFLAVFLSFPILILPAIGFIFIGVYHRYYVKKYTEELLELIEYDKDPNTRTRKTS